jgi:hypothetical protein
VIIFHGFIETAVHGCHSVACYASFSTSVKHTLDNAFTTWRDILLTIISSRSYTIPFPFSGLCFRPGVRSKEGQTNRRHCGRRTNGSGRWHHYADTEATSGRLPVKWLNRFGKDSKLARSFQVCCRLLYLGLLLKIRAGLSLCNHVY